MVHVHDLGVVALTVLGLAFLLGWNSARLNQATLLWGIAHLALAGASFTGYRYQLGGSPGLALLATLLTGLFLASLHAATQFLRGHTASPGGLAVRTLAVAFLIASVGFGGDQTAGRILVVALMMLAYGTSAYLFHRMGYRLLAAAFAFKAASFLLYFLEPATLGTTQQSPWISAVSWVASVALGMVLVNATIVMARERLANVIRHTPDALVARRLDGTVLFCNELFAQLAGKASPEELVGRPVPMLAADAQQAEAVFRKVNAMVEARQLLEPMRLERQVSPAHGEPFPAEIIFSSYMDLGYPVVLGLIRDLSERKKAEQERLHQANTDQLTGLPHRSFLEQRLETVLWVGQRQGTQSAVLLVDLDHFKKINDTLGHGFGDEILRDVARALQAQCAAGDLLARVSGDEFAVVMTGLPSLLSVLQVEARAQAVLHAVRRSFRRDGMDYLVDATIGIAFSGREGMTASVLLQNAEVAMYESKARGRGGWCFYDAGMDERLAESLRLESALRHAVAQDELRLHYQPIHCAATGSMVKAEALVRWESPRLGQVSPARFIPLAEESSLILQIGQWVIGEALRQLAVWRRHGWQHPVVSINVSVRQLAQPDFESQLFALLHQHRLPPACIELELTETILASGEQGLPALLQRLHGAGVGLSLDDFGTGYSSLSYLTQFNLTTVKIDRSFVMGLEDGNRNHSLVRAIISMAHSLHLEVVAEGVETPRQRDLLQREACDFLQGYLLGLPMPADALRLHTAEVAGLVHTLPDPVI